MAAVSVPAGSVPKARPQPRKPPPSVGQAGCGERVGHGGVAVPDEQRALEGERHGFGEMTGAGLGRVAEFLAQPADRLVQAAVRPGRLIEFGEERLGRLGLPGQGAQRVERGDVARTLPDRRQRSLPVQAGHPRFLHVAVAAQAFEGLGGVRGGALAHPVLGRRQRQAAERGLLLIAADRAVGRPGQPERRHRGRLRLDREVGQHAGHQRLFGQFPAEGRPVGGVVRGRS